MKYKCIDCGKEVELDLRTAKKIICPFCGHRILKKARPPVARAVVSR
jgi:DNA-directed RNA polymerase subunit RPC12/RpoP